uniref:Uncharacterized protein n=1 Tax=Pyxicephalus adspersus TaxID=30357 RepID=A0AAV3AW51_PYXAD|nr:TPA: hypothetical protein GDO54_007736 [Pyxicephalus adspersus]
MRTFVKLLRVSSPSMIKCAGHSLVVVKAVLEFGCRTHCDHGRFFIRHWVFIMQMINDHTWANFFNKNNRTGDLHILNKPSHCQ